MGKPLISDVQMLAIYETMLRLRSLEQEAHASASHTPAHAAGSRIYAPIALLAATLLQLRPTDLLVIDTEDLLAKEVLIMAQETTFSPDSQATCVAVGTVAAAVASGHALALVRSARPGDDAPVTVALLRGTPNGLAETMQFAGASVLPLLLILQGGEAARARLIESIPNVEVIQIDANDAVACCRVMQESLLRTRNRWGCVLLQAVTLPGAADPVASFETHLRRRNLLREG